MAYTGRIFGFQPLVGKLFPILFGHDFLTDEAFSDSREHWRQQLINNHPAGSSRAAMAVIKRGGVYSQLGLIKTPTLVLVGDQDVATTTEKAQRMHDAIQHSKLVVIAGAGHSSSIEKPEAVTRALRKFISVH